MEHDIAALKTEEVDAIVVGALTADGEIDQRALHRLCAASEPLPVTFHRAIDMARSPVVAVRVLCKFPAVTHVLSSGAAKCALDGVPLLRAMREAIEEELKTATDVSRVGIIAGGGIGPQNVQQIIRDADVDVVHGSFRSAVQSDMKHRNTLCSMGGQSHSEYVHQVTSASQVSMVVRAVQGVQP